MAEQEAQRGSFWSSLPGILTGVAGLITAISGLAVWQHSTPNPTPAPAPIVQPVTNPGTTPVTHATTPTVPIGSEQWCSEKYTAWKSEKDQTGVDDAALRKQIVQAHCNQFGVKLGKVKEQ
jgi:hypothetical protein